MMHKIEMMISPGVEPVLPAEERKVLERLLTAKNRSGEFCFGNVQVSRFLKDCYQDAAPSEAGVRRWRKDCFS